MPPGLSAMPLLLLLHLLLFLHVPSTEPALTGRAATPTRWRQEEEEVDSARWLKEEEEEEVGGIVQTLQRPPMEERTEVKSSQPRCAQKR